MKNQFLIKSILCLILSVLTVPMAKSQQNTNNCNDKTYTTKMQKIKLNQNNNPKSNCKKILKS